MAEKKCFVICPIGSEGSRERKRANDLLKYIISKSLAELEYTIIRADKIAKPGMITNQIIENLIEADLVIADLFDYNPNVFYELSIRHVINKPVIQIYHPDQPIPFDVSVLRSIKLDITNLESVEKCKEELILQAKAIIDHPEEITSPFSITIDLQTLREGNTSTEQFLSRIMEGIDRLRSEIVYKKRKDPREDGSRNQMLSNLFKQKDRLFDEYINLKADMGTDPDESNNFAAISVRMKLILDELDEIQRIINSMTGG